MLASCGHDAAIQFYDITQGKEIKRIDLNPKTSTTGAVSSTLKSGAVSKPNEV